MSYITKCTVCSKIIHRVNYRYCCGIDYYIPPVIETKEQEIVEEPKQEKPKKKKKKRKNTKTPKRIRLMVLDRDRNRCTKCKSTERLEVHHTTHRKHGGTDDINNLVTLCEQCHTEEHKDEPVYRIRKIREAARNNN